MSIRHRLHVHFSCLLLPLPYPETGNLTQEHPLSKQYLLNISNTVHQERSIKARIKQQYLVGNQTEVYCTWYHPKNHDKTKEWEFSNCKMLIRN